ncbi:hypothetical protein [Pseudomonas chlororaphis]|uniref:hypothetical protein n=1 Tax=Pseudomonas chlororaphis TaxID=587753 RepID=UPI0015DF19FB|nr:hypothetical protein [Pseudomonas chlororaphis]QLL11747.1 hypothetical protein H0I86_22340 [Pseudomonas chlororaphis subsp. aurantiaca]
MSNNEMVSVPRELLESIRTTCMYTMPGNAYKELSAILDAPPHCPECGYTEQDCREQMDHHLCGLPEPAPAKVTGADVLRWMDEHAAAQPQDKLDQVNLASFAMDMSTCTLTTGDGTAYFYNRIDLNKAEQVPVCIYWDAKTQDCLDSKCGEHGAYKPAAQPVPPAGYAPCSPELLEPGVDCATAPRWSSPTWDGHSHWHPMPPAGGEPEALVLCRNCANKGQDSNCAECQGRVVYYVKPISKAFSDWYSRNPYSELSPGTLGLMAFKAGANFVRAHVTRLLAENKRLDLMVAQGDYNRDATVIALRAELDALKAQLQGEPVGFATKRNGKIGSWLHSSQRQAENFDSTADNGKPGNSEIFPVYRHQAEPPAPVAVVLPVRYESNLFPKPYRDGWNACLDEVARLNSL